MNNKPEFLKRIPLVLDAKQRFGLEGLSFAFDAVELSFLRIKSILETYDPKSISNMKHLDRVAVFSDAWSIIDRVHLIFLLLDAVVGKAENQNDKKDYKDKKFLNIIIDEDQNKDVRAFRDKYKQDIVALRHC